MIFAFNEKYFKNNKLLKKAVLISSIVISRWCTYYQTSVWTTKKIKAKYNKGNLPKSKKEKEIFIKELVNYIFNNSEMEGLFALFLDPRPIDKVRKMGQVAKFDHHDDTCCWALNLTDKEFKILQNAFHKNGLPKNLFVKAYN